MNASLLLLLPLLAWVAWMFWRARPQVQPAELRSALQTGTAVLIDVREPAEWHATGTVRDAALLPLSDLHGSRHQWRAFLEKHRDKRLFLYCQSGSRSALAAALLRREGYDACNAGSLAALEQAGWPLSHKRP